MMTYIKTHRTAQPLRISRRGLTLIEVVVSMAIFLMALGGIVPLIKLGLDRAMDIQLQATALQKCQSKISEIMVGSEPIAAQSDAVFPDNNPDEDWRWSMDMAQEDIDGVWTINVRVYLQLDSHRVEVALSQIVMDPSIRGGPAPAPTTSSGTTSGTTTGSTTTGGG